MSRTKKRRHSRAVDLQLVARDPRRERIKHLSLALAALVILLIGLGLGVSLEKINSSKSDSPATQADVAKLRQRLAILQTDKAISSHAQDKVQQKFKELRDQLAELKKAVSFYKGIMAPGSQQEGLHIEKLSIHHTDEGQYRFSLILAQLGNNRWRPYLKGKVSWQLIGTQDGKPVTLGGSVFVTDGSDNSFRFRYFQELSGTLQVPADITPKKVIISAVSNSQRDYRAQHTYQWTQLEHNDNAGS